MRCTNKECDSTKTKIVKSNTIVEDAYNAVIRTRRCEKCGKEYQTIELSNTVLSGALGLISASEVLAKCMIFGIKNATEDSIPDEGEVEETEDQKDE